MATNVPRGIRTERGVQQQGLGSRGSQQEAPGDVNVPGPARDPGLNVNPNQFGAQVGRAMEGFGASLGHVAEAQRQLEERRKNAEDKMFLARARSGLNKRLYQDYLDLQGEFKPGDNALEMFQERANQAREETLTALREEFNPSSDALDSFELMAVGQTENYALRTITFENNQHIAAYERSYDMEAEEAARSAFATGDLKGNLAHIDTVTAAAEGVFPHATLMAKKDEARRLVSLSYAEGIAREDPGVLWDELSGGSPNSLVGAVIAQESGGDFTAVGADGEGGAMQVMPNTARQIAQEMGDENFPHDGSDEAVRQYLIDANHKGANGIRYGTYYLEKMMRRFDGDAEAALIAYNAGPSRAEAWLKAGRDDSVIPASTRKYYKKVLGRMDEGGETDLDVALRNMTVQDQIRLMGKADRGRKARLSEFSDRFEDHIANIERFGDGLDGFSVNQAAGLTDEETLAELRAREEQAYQDHTSINAIYYGAPGDALSAVTEAAPVPGTENIEAQFKRRERFRDALQDRLNATKSSEGSSKFDPAGYAQTGFDDVQGAYEQAFESMETPDIERAVRYSMQAQDFLGVAEHDKRILPKQLAQQLVADIQQTPTAEQAGKIAALQQQFGKFGDELTRELGEAGLTPAQSVAALYTDNPALSQEIITATANAKEIADTLDNLEAKDIKERVAQDMEEFRSSFQAGDYTGTSAAVFNDFKTAVTNVALLRASRGMDDVDGLLDEMIYDRFHVGLVGGTVWAPKEFNAGAIEGAARGMRFRSKIEEFNPEAFNTLGGPAFLDRELTIRNAATQGFWVTNEAGDGAILMVPIGGATLPLVNEDGDLYGFKFEDASRLAVEGPAAPPETVVTP